MNQARQQLTRAETEIRDAQSELSAIEETAATARKLTDEKKATLAEAQKQVKSIETRILSEQRPGSSYFTARQEVENAQLRLDGVVHRILALPPHDGPVSDQQRMDERLRFTESQKARLKQDPAYEQAAEEVRVATERLGERRRQLFAINKDWQQASAAVKEAQDAVKSAESDSRKAGFEVARQRRELAARTAQATQLRGLITDREWRLQSLGVNPNPQRSSAPAAPSGTMP